MSLADQLWCPTSAQVTVLQARGLKIKGKGGTNDAFAVMQVGKEKYQTSVSEKSVAPVWKEEATFDLPQPPGGGGGADRSTLHVHVLHRALVGPDKLLGQAVINLPQLSQDKTRNKTEWFKLLDKAGKADKDRGEVLVDIQFLRNNMTASMFDLSAAGKSKSRLGKFKDKVRGKKKDSDAASTAVPSFPQVLTDSEDEEGNGDGEAAAAKDEKKKKKKIKSLFSPKTNLQRNMSQSMSVLPAKNSLSGSQSSGLNVDTSEGKKKFKFMMHKRSGSSGTKDSSSAQPKGAEQSNLCINGSHVYCDEPQNRNSRIGSNFSLASSGHGSMEDATESSPPSVDSMRTSRQCSPWTEEEEEIPESVKEEEEETGMEKEKEGEGGVRMEEEENARRKEEEKVREEEERRKVEEKRRLEEKQRWLEEKARKEEEMIRLEEERRKEEKRRVEEEERKQHEEEKARMEEERQKERKRVEEEERRLEEEKARKEELRRIEMERLEEEERQHKEEEARKREQKKMEEEERARKEEELRKEMERRVEEEERVREEEERRKEMERVEEEERARKEEERRKEMERVEEEERARKEEERRKEMERVREEEERRKEMERVEEEERARKEEERRKEMERRKMEEEERARKEEELRKEMERRVEEEERARQEEERRKKEEEEKIRIEEEICKEKDGMLERQEREKMKQMEEQTRQQEDRKEEEEKASEKEKYKIMKGRKKEEEKGREKSTIEERKRIEEERIKEEEKAGEEKEEEKKSQDFPSEEQMRKKSVKVTSLNPFDEDFDPSSPAGLHRNQPAVALLRTRTSSSEDKDHGGSQRDKRPAPQPPGRQQAPRGLQADGKGPDVRIALPQRSFQAVSPVSRSDPQRTFAYTSSAPAESKHGKGPAPAARTSPASATSSGVKREPVTCSLNPFEDEEDEPAAEDEAGSGPRQWAAAGAGAHAKIKSSKKARAPALPELPDASVSLNPGGDPDPAVTLPDNDEAHSRDPNSVSEAKAVTPQGSGGKKEEPPSAKRRLLPVKPLNPLRQSITQEGKDIKPIGIFGDETKNTKVDPELKGPYSQLTKAELISLVLKQENQLLEKDKKISELEKYIDNLLVRVMEEQPSILMSINSLKKAV